MNTFRSTLTALAIVAFTLTVSLSSQAQSRTWVSGVGDDLNPCSRTAPCKTFNGAISKTAKDGEIDALDPGGFGAVTVSKSITIDGSMTGSAGILNSSTSGVTVNITDAADVRKSVTLRGLSMQGAGTGLRGVRILAANKVFVENCWISGQNGSPGHGIDDTRSAGGFLEVDNTTITNNNGSGINVANTTGNALNVHVSNSRLEANSNTGLVLGNGSKGTIVNSVVNQNTAGFFLSSSIGVAELSVDQCVVSNNGTGFIANAGGTIRVANTTAMNNGTLATVAGGGAVSSYSAASNQTGGLAFPSASTAKQ